MKRSAVLRALFLVVSVNSDSMSCLHGIMGDDGCECEANYYGINCDTLFNCNYTGNPGKGLLCDACKPNWSGGFCDIIDCGENGKRSINHPQTCVCDAPFTGQFCTALNTSDVYRYYNQRVSKYIPFGVLVIVPAMILILVCNFCSERRQTKRVEEVVRTSYLKELDAEAVESMMLRQSRNSHNNK